MKWTVLLVVAAMMLCGNAALADTPPEKAGKAGSRTKTAPKNRTAGRSAKDEPSKSPQGNPDKAKAKAEKARREKAELDTPENKKKRSKSGRKGNRKHRKSSTRKTTPADDLPEPVDMVEPIPELPKTHVLIETSVGDMTFELEDGEAPITVSNFLYYADSGFYEGLIFHRVIPDFVVQGGGYTLSMDRKSPTGKLPVPLETSEKLKNVAGTIAMARTKEPNSALTEFFINVVDNPHLDFPGWDGYGYAVFGHLIDGMEVLQAIRDASCTHHPQYSGPSNDPEQCNPDPPIVIKKIRRLKTNLQKKSENDPSVTIPTSAPSEPPHAEPRKHSSPRKNNANPRKKTRKL